MTEWGLPGSDESVHVLTGQWPLARWPVQGAPAGGQVPGEAHVTPPYLATFPSLATQSSWGEETPFLPPPRQPLRPPTALSRASHLRHIWGKGGPEGLQGSQDGWWGLDLGWWGPS